MQFTNVFFKGGIISPSILFHVWFLRAQTALKLLVECEEYSIICIIKASLTLRLSSCFTETDHPL